MTESTQSVVVSARNLTKTFSSTAQDLVILDEAEITVSQSQSVVITGPSGSGKSTLLYILGSLEKPTHGTIEINGRDIFSLDANSLAKFRNKEIGFVFQDHHLLPQCTVIENILLPCLANEGVNLKSQERANELLTQTGLIERSHHHPSQLSGGERQRVAICRALINEPSVILADEPTGSLDPKTAETVGQMLLDLPQTQNTALICVTHSLEYASKFQRHLKLSQGKLAE